MQQINTAKSSIVIIGGIGVGKSSIIEATWPNRQAVSVSNDSHSVYEISDDIPGRGIMNYTVTEMPSVLFSLPKRWIKNEQNMHFIAKSNAIVFVVSADSLGYKLEMSFLRILLKSDAYNGQHIVICISKSDALLHNKAKELDLDGLSILFKRQTSLYRQVEQMVDDSKFDIESIVPVSATLQWNFNTLKEKIWEGVISNINDQIFNENIPTIVIAGKRGCGKSSTLNSLWKLNLPTNKAVACTKYPMLIHIEDEYDGKKLTFNIVDLPGIAESIDADMRYIPFYKKYINNATLLICLSQADTRAYLQDEVFYKYLISQGVLTPETDILLGINQIDLLFKDKEHLNGIDLNTISEDHPLIKAKIDDYYDKIYSGIFKDFPKVTRKNVCVFSVLQDWNTSQLKSKIYNHFK